MVPFGGRRRHQRVERDLVDAGALHKLDVASQGDSVEDARKNLTEAVELFYETADQSEIAARLHGDVFVTRLEVAIG